MSTVIYVYALNNQLKPTALILSVDRRGYDITGTTSIHFLNIGNSFSLEAVNNWTWEIHRNSGEACQVSLL